MLNELRMPAGANLRKISVYRQSMSYFKVAFVLVIIVSIGHLLIGSSFAVVLIAATAFLMSLLPLLKYGIYNIAAILIALLGLRYVGFPLFAKLFMRQTLDSYLMDPIGSFGVVLVGIAGYLIAFWLAAKLPIGKPYLFQSIGHQSTKRISYIAAVVGISANLAIASRTGQEHLGVGVAEFYVSFLHLSLIAGIAYAIEKSRRRMGIDLWVAIIFVSEIAFGMVRNSRVTLMEATLCYVITVSAFRLKIRWRQFGIVSIAVGLMVVFVTPVFLYVRNIQGSLSWNARILATMDASANWPQAFSNFLKYRDRQDQLGWYLNYYGSAQNVFERMSYINHVDVLKQGIDVSKSIGFEDLRLSFIRAMPRILVPDKPIEYSRGYRLYSGIGIAYPGPFATAPLIATGYAAFLWVGSFLYPFVFGFVFLLLLRKITGWQLNSNIWALYLLLRVHNQFVEGSTDAYLIHILRNLPQDFILLWLMNIFANNRVAVFWRKRRFV